MLQATPAPTGVLDDRTLRTLPALRRRLGVSLTELGDEVGAHPDTLGRILLALLPGETLDRVVVALERRAADAGLTPRQ